jgi:hypothetical protein
VHALQPNAALDVINHLYLMLMDSEFEIPDAVSDEPQEVFAFVGLALYAASVLEAELINLAVGLRANSKNEQIYQEEVDEWFSENEARTFGSLANSIRKMTTLNSETEDLVFARVEGAEQVCSCVFPQSFGSVHVSSRKSSDDHRAAKRHCAISRR